MISEDDWDFGETRSVFGELRHDPSCELTRDTTLEYTNDTESQGPSKKKVFKNKAQEKKDAIKRYKERLALGIEKLI